MTGKPMSIEEGRAALARAAARAKKPVDWNRLAKFSEKEDARLAQVKANFYRRAGLLKK